MEPWHISNVIACLKTGAGWVHDKDADDLTLADIIVHQDIDKAPVTLGGRPLGASNSATFPFESKGEARKGLPGVKINGKSVNGNLDAKVTDLFVGVVGDACMIPGIRVALISFGKKFRTVIITF